MVAPNPSWHCLFFFTLTFFVGSVMIQCVAGVKEADGAATEAVEPGTGHFDTGGLSREVFPKGFVFGTSTSAYQVEGMTDKDGRGPCIWDDFVKIPRKIKDGKTAKITADQYNRYEEDVDNMSMFNFDAYRFSISWSRIFPDGNGKVNWDGVAYYNRLIDYLIKKGITPYVTLYHFDLPQALELRYNGLLGRDVVKDFTDYADFCFKTFGKKVKNWITFNEPRVIAAFGFGDGSHAPGRCSKEYGHCTAGNSGTEPYIAVHNMLLAHAAAVERYRQNHQEEQKGRIGIVLDFVWFDPLTKSKADNLAAQRAIDFNIGWLIHPITYGEYPRTMQEILVDRLPKFSEEEVKLVRGSFDFIGINHYTTNYASEPRDLPKLVVPSYQTDWHVALHYEKREKRIGSQANSKWIYNVPWGMFKSLMYIKKHYGNPIMIICENGMDDPGNEALRHDTKRIDYYKGYLRYLKKAVDYGANVVGYFAWSLLDNFEWNAGYTSRFGIFYVDFKTLERKPKMSAYWFKQMLTRKKHF